MACHEARERESCHRRRISFFLLEEQQEKRWDRLLSFSSLFFFKESLQMTHTQDWSQNP